MMRSTLSLDEENETPITAIAVTQPAPTSKTFYTNKPTGFPFFSYATPPSPEEDKALTQEIGIGFDCTEDCDLIDIRDIAYRDLAYDRSEVDLLLKKMLEKNGYISKRSMNVGFKTAYTIYEHKDSHEQVALFSVVKDREDRIFLKDSYILSLEECFRIHSDAKERNTKIVVPIVTSIMYHYRLLTLDLQKNIGLYHDSKSAIASSSTELARALISAGTAYAAQNLNANVGVHPALLPNFFDAWHYVETNSQRFFYNIPVVENRLNQQEFYSERDTGAYVVSYADLFLQGQDLQVPFELDINKKKTEYHKLLFPKPTDTIDSPSNTLRLSR